MPTTVTARNALIAEAQAQWAETEASIARAARGAFETRPAAEQWSAGEIYRHIVDTAHKVPEALEQIVRGEAMTALTPGDERGLEDFKHLSARLLAVELNTAHGLLAMALHKLSDADLEKPVEMFMEGTLALGALARQVFIDHEKVHVEQALRAAGPE